MPRHDLDNKQKLAILDEILAQEKIGKTNFTEIGKKFSVDRTTVARISKTRETLKENISNGQLLQKRKRQFKEQDVDEALFSWVKAKLHQDARLNLPILKTKATELAKAMGHDFTPSEGWLNRFKERHSLKFKKEHGEKQATDVAAATNFKKDILPRLLEIYDKNNIFNADETGLYFKGLPDRGYAPSNETLSGGKKAKERVTVLVCANMSGTEKRKLMVIRKSKRPRSFPRDLSSLPVSYTNSANAWMTGTLFQEHMDEWNRSLRCQGRKILLLLDNCSAHPSAMAFSNIEIVFLPPNTTSTIQPMDMGVIRNLKGHYRKKINERIIAELDADETKKAVDAIKNINLLNAIYMISEAWSEVKMETIINCYAKAGFVDESRLEPIEEEILQPPSNLTEDQFNALVDQDEDLEVCGPLTDAEIVQEVKRRKIDTAENEEKDDDDVPAPQPTKQELLIAVNTMRTFLQNRGKPHLLPHFKAIETEVLQSLHEKKKQTTILEMFSKMSGSSKTPDQ